ncbi:MAG: alpha/beta hydrolase [Caldilineaceae bacterium]
MSKVQKQKQAKPLVGIIMALLALTVGCAPLVQPAPNPIQPSATLPSASVPSATPNASDAGEVTASGITLAYERFGPTDGEAILLIAGTGMQMVDWPMPLVNALVARDYGVIRFDNRDIGRSTHLDEAGLPDSAAIEKALTAGAAPPLPYTIRDMAADTVGLLDALGIDQAHIVGASQGGAIAQMVAIDYPARVRSLTLLMADSANPAMPVVAKPEAFANVPPQPQDANDRDAYIEWQVKAWQALNGPDYPLDEATLREWAARDFERGYDPAGFARQGTAILVDRYEPTAYRHSHLESISAPTVIVQGEADPIVPVAAAEELAALIPNAELRLIPGLGHNIPDPVVPQIVDAITAAAEQFK